MMTTQNLTTDTQLEITLYELYDLSASDAADIEGGSFEIIGEDESGNEGSWECSIVELAGKAYEAITNQAARIAELEQQIQSRVVCDGLPTFYISTEGAVCTHRLSESDTPIWCRSGDDGMAAMQSIQGQTTPPQEPKS